MGNHIMTYNDINSILKNIKEKTISIKEWKLFFILDTNSELEHETTSLLHRIIQLNDRPDLFDVESDRHKFSCESTF